MSSKPVQEKKISLEASFTINGDKRYAQKIENENGIITSEDLEDLLTRMRLSILKL